MWNPQFIPLPASTFLEWYSGDIVTKEKKKRKTWEKEGEVGGK